MLEPCFATSIRVLALEQLGKCRIRAGQIAGGHLASAGGEQGVFPQLCRQTAARSQTAEWSQRLPTLAYPRESDTPKQLGLFRVLAGGMADENCLRLGGDLAPKVIGLERPAI